MLVAKELEDRRVLNPLQWEESLILMENILKWDRA